MRNSLLFADGAVHAALWTTGPLLLPSLLLGDDDGGGGGRSLRRPLAEISNDGASGNSTAASAAAAALDDAASARGLTASAAALSSSTVAPHAWVLVAFLVGRALGRRFVGDNVCGSCPRASLWLRGLPPRRAACLLTGLSLSLLAPNWGLGVSTFRGWMAIRFATAFVSGAAEAWAGGALADEGRGRREKDDDSEEERVGLMEEARAEEGDEIGSSPSSSQRLLEKKWLDSYWLAGAATSAFVGGMSFYPLNRLTVAFHPHERMYTFLLVVGIGLLIDRCLVRYHSESKHPSFVPSAAPSSSDAGTCAGGGHGITNHEKNLSSPLQRQKQVHPQPSMQTMFEEEQEIIFHDNSIQRSNSFDSQQFFDCLDEIEPESEHNYDIEAGTKDGDGDHIDLESGTKARTPTPSHENQIAVYSGRSVVYPDGTPAYVPEGESISATPPGYLVLYKNNRSKARERYQQTQEWRRRERIHRIHTRPHVFFSRMKAAYPHILHGFTPCGMPVVYEEPGKMKLKECMREAAKHGGKVEDLVSHYSYFMEYMSNLESILPELHSDDDGGDDDDDGAWQEELAAYVRAKQKNLEKDPVAYRYCVVMDISGLGPSIASMEVLDYLKRSGDVNTLHYPGSLRRIIAVKAPRMVNMAWKIVDPLKPASLTIEVMSGAEMAEGGLLKFIDEDQIPPEFGGRSRFRLGEHPFEVGIRKLVERQVKLHPEIRAPLSVVDPPLSCDSTPIKFPQSLPAERNVERKGGKSTTSAENTAETKGGNIAPVAENGAVARELEMGAGTKRNRPVSSSAEDGAATHEWDGLGSQSVLTVTAVLHFFVFTVVGSLELALPYWMISPTTYGGLGCEAGRNGTALLASSVIVAWLVKRSRLSRLMRSTIESSPLRGFRIGIGTACFVLVDVGLMPLISDPEGSTLVLLYFSAHLSLAFCGCALGILSLERVRSAALNSAGEGDGGGDDDGALPEGRRARGVPASSGPSPSATAGRIAGYACVAPVLRRSVRSDLLFPFDASLSLCLPACVCWLLYVVSFSLHATTTTAPAPPPARDRTRRESRFVGAVVSCYSFVREVLLVALADTGFLANQLCPSRASRDEGGRG